MKSLGRVCALLVFFGSISTSFSQPFPTTPLDDYIAANNNPTWNLVQTATFDMYQRYRVDLISQQWRTLADVNRVNWQHDVSIYVPTGPGPISSTALLVISGGSNNPGWDTSADSFAGLVTSATRMPVIYLPTVPNQPLRFTDETFNRSEDAIIAYTWDKYLNSFDAGTPDPTWIAQLPMANSVIRTMDMVQSFLGSPQGGNVQVDDFFLAGGSKRGWTTWLAAAAEAQNPDTNRVSAIFPLVIDLLNTQQSFEHHFDVYGFWAPAVQDYVNAGIMDRMFTPGADALMSIVDPLSYVDRLTMPKVIINSTGDQFFLPDSSQFYFDQLQGPKYLKYIPNTDHGLSDDFATLVEAFSLVLAAEQGALPPEFTWEILPNGAIQVNTGELLEVLEVVMWQATNPNARDFRLQTIGPSFASEILQEIGNGTYIARPPNPEEGWTAFLVEVAIANPLTSIPFRFTTDVNVIGVPEPSTLALAILGLSTAGILLRLRSRPRYRQVALADSNHAA